MKTIFNNSNVLITGGAGFLGNSLSDSLLKAGVNLYILVRSENYLNIIEKGNCVYVLADLRDSKGISEAFYDIDLDYIFHFGGSSTVEQAGMDPNNIFETNINGTINILNLALSKAVKGFFFASSIKVYSNDLAPPLKENYLRANKTAYGTSKICAEYLINYFATNLKLPAIIFRLGSVFGENDLNFSRVVPYIINCLLRNEKPIIRSPKNLLLDLIYVKDVINALLLVSKKFINDEKSILEINISTGNPTTIGEVLTILNGINKNKGEKIEKPIQSIEKFGAYLSPDILINDYGWEPKYSIDEGLENTYNWYKKHIRINENITY